MAFLGVSQLGWRRLLVEEADMRGVALHVINIDIVQVSFAMQRDAAEKTVKRRDFRRQDKRQAPFPDR